MWLFTRYGFYSIACAELSDGNPDPATMMIRARRKSHLGNLQARFPELATCAILTSTQTDYRYRMLVPKAQWSRVVAELVEEQTWSNFKREVAQYQGMAGHDYERALHQVWNVMARLQPRDQA